MHLAQAMESALMRCKNERADKRLAATEGCKRQFALILQSRSSDGQLHSGPMNSPFEHGHYSRFLKGVG
jgi:hypothetical protein